MFPLGTVLFPGVVLPLHVFEPRYREMTRFCLRGLPEFGVVLIERGSEVGGGDMRTDIGTVARIRDAEELPDGRWILTTIGTRRIKVHAWLPDDPYPRADVEDFPDEPEGSDLTASYDILKTRLRRVLALASELGANTVSVGVQLLDDPALGCYQVAAVAPIGPADAYRVLAAPSAAARVTLLDKLLAEIADDLERRLMLG